MMSMPIGNVQANSPKRADNTCSMESAVKPRRRWDTFVKLYRPVAGKDGNCFVWPWALPKDADERYWWTVFDPMEDLKVYLSPGIRKVDRLGYVRCELPWDGEACQHPDYRFNPRRRSR